MDTKRSTALAASIAAAAAFVLILGSTFSGIPFTTTAQTSIGPTSSSTSQTQSQPTQSSSQQTSQQTSSQQTSSQQSSSQEGTLSVLLTDPPNVPAGVTKVYVDYEDLAVHAWGGGSAGGWLTIKAAGSIELLGTVNISQTISSVKVNVGSYDMIRFNITGAEVTYYGKNYTAFIQTTSLTIPIVGGIDVSPSIPCATIIDISPTVINAGTQSSPQFIITSVADAYPVPSAVVVSVQAGSMMNLTGLSWWQTIAQQSTAHLKIGAASLNSTYLNLKVLNTGGNATMLHLVTLTPVVNATTTASQGVLPTALGQSAIFIVLSNGTLVQVQIFMTAQMSSTSASAISASLFSKLGLELPPGATASITHPRGVILLGFMGMAVETPVGGILKGHQYLVTVIGTQASASLLVTAS
jgi:hypothetical protein